TGINAFAEEFFGHADFETFDLACQSRYIVGDVDVDRCGIVRIMPSDGLQHVSTVLHILRQRSDLVEGRGKRHESEARDKTVRRFQSDYTAKRGGLANGPPRIRSQAEIHFSRGDRRGGTAA